MLLRRCAHLSLPFALALLLWGCTTGEPGQSTYATYCQGCHLPSGAGIEGIYPPLVETDWVSGDPARLIRLTLDGVTGPMEVNGVIYDHTKVPHSFLTDQEVADVLTFIRTRYGGGASAITAEQVATIRAANESDGLWEARVLEATTGFPAANDAPGGRGESSAEPTSRIEGDSASRQPAEPATTGTDRGAILLAGSAVYERVCQACHQVDGSGVAMMYPPLVEGGWLSGGDERLIKLILRGMMGEHEVARVTYRGVMPPHASLSDEEIAAVIAFARSEFAADDRMVAPSLVAKIRADTEGQAIYQASELE